MTGRPINEMENLQATIFDVQGFSLQDGPGIRTTVFFKGCPLRCRWCHNPESLSIAPQLMYHATLCVGCMQCADSCPNQAHRFRRESGRLVHEIDRERCNACGACLAVCNYDALSMVGQMYTPERLYERIKGDLVYYQADAGGQQGGITFSGGEPMLHVPFIKAFKTLVPGVHLAMETSGYAPREAFEGLGDEIDLFLFDYKATDPARHRSLCGVDNRLILSNLEYLCNRGLKVILRLPLIPGVNDDDGHLEGIARVLKAYPGIVKAEIMPYHNLGINKRIELGMSPQTWGAHGADEATQQRWLHRLQHSGAGTIELSK